MLPAARHSIAPHPLRRIFLFSFGASVPNRFEDAFGLRHHALFNGVRFFLFGCAIGLMSWFAYRRRRAGNPRPCPIPAQKGSRMCLFDCDKPQKSLPVLLVLLVVAQINLVYALDWPHTLLTWLHLTPAPNDAVRGMSAGFAASIDVLALYQLARIWARRALQPGNAAQRD